MILRRHAPRIEASGNTKPLEIVYRADPAVFDGRFANNGWLRTAKADNKLTWDNAAMMSAATAQKLGIVTGDYVKLQLGNLETKQASFLSGAAGRFPCRSQLGYAAARGNVGRDGFNTNSSALPRRLGLPAGCAWKTQRGQV